MDSSNVVNQLADYMDRQEAQFKEKEKKYKEEIEDAYRRGKAEGYRQALLERESVPATRSIQVANEATEKFWKDRFALLQQKAFDNSEPKHLSKQTGNSGNTAWEMKSNILISAIIGMCKELGYCPGVIGWDDHPSCGGRPELCEGCWESARKNFEKKGT